MSNQHPIKIAGSGGCPDTVCPALYVVVDGYWVQGAFSGNLDPESTITVEVPAGILDDVLQGVRIPKTAEGTYRVTGPWVGADGHARLTNCADHETAVFVPAAALASCPLPGVV